MNPRRFALPFDAWPEPDRQAWRALFREGDLLDGRGEAAHWATRTRQTNQRHYARWLAWLKNEGLLEASSPPADRATPERVEAYARQLIDNVAPRTAASMLIGLKCVLKRMEPGRDWRWLMDLTNRLDSWAPTSRNHGIGDLDPAAMFAKLVAELENLSGSDLARRAEGLRFRDTLLVAILLTSPIRARNLAMMRLGEHLRQEGSEWRIRFAGAETKTGQPINLIVPRELRPPFETYLDRVRPAFLGDRRERHLWLTWAGVPQKQISQFVRIKKTSAALFGVALGPHAFRTVAATALAESSPEDALHARPLLGHRQPDTTRKHYVRARQIEASKVIASVLKGI